mmetsp:Transcript_66086/g.166637  ORF Transcript_66086/g.166637 Transcript_66086/m.166637 type:complete len:201 (+) Transcript_66086:613-1215(+)
MTHRHSAESSRATLRSHADQIRGALVGIVATSLRLEATAALLSSLAPSPTAASMTTSTSTSSSSASCPSSSSNCTAKLVLQGCSSTDDALTGASLQIDSGCCAAVSWLSSVVLAPRVAADLFFLPFRLDRCAFVEVAGTSSSIKSSASAFAAAEAAAAVSAAAAMASRCAWKTASSTKRRACSCNSGHEPGVVSATDAQS